MESMNDMILIYPGCCESNANRLEIESDTETVISISK